MPEREEDVIHKDVAVHEKNNKTSKKCKKILKLFRHMRKENFNIQTMDEGLEKKEKKNKKKKFWDMDERKEAFKKNMEGSWADLPNTLKRKKENISEDILSEFHDSDSSDSENSNLKPFGKRERSYDFNSEIIETTCEYFRQKREEELDTTSMNRITEEKLVKREKFPNYKKTKYFNSEKVIEHPKEDEQISLERIRKLSEGEYENSALPANFEIEKKNDSYDLKAAVDEINLLFHDLIEENGGQNNSSTSSDSGTSEPYVNIIFSSLEKKDNDVKSNVDDSKVPREKIDIKRSNSTDSLLNGSVSWASDLSQQEIKYDKNKDEELNVLNVDNSIAVEGASEITYVKEDLKAKSTDSAETESKRSEETLALLDKIYERNTDGDVPLHLSNTGTQYSNLIFPVKSKSLPPAEQISNDVITNVLQEEKELKQVEGRIIYQELDFIKSQPNIAQVESTKSEETREEKSNEKKLEGNTADSQSVPGVLSSLSEEQKAKKKSAEAIARELSSQVFNKKTQSEEESLERKNVLTISINTTKKPEAVPECISSTVKKTEEKSNLTVKNNEIENIRKNVCGISSDRDDSWNFGEKSEWGNVSLQYFSVADWRKAVALGSKRGINSVVMETIVEEPETDTSTKLTVREILRRFEELGNKHFNDKLCMTDDERTATLKQIHQTLKCLEEKVKNFENWSESNFQQQHYQEGSRTTNFSSGGWTGSGTSQRPAIALSGRSHNESEEIAQTSVNDGKHSLLQFAIHHFRQSPEKFEMLKTSDGSISGSLKVIESKNKKNKDKGKAGSKNSSEWTWKEQVDLVKFTAKPIEQSLLQLDPELSDLAVECFLCLMRYMGDLPMPTDVSEVKCVYTILMHCHKYETLRDEVYCQLMKQTTNNKSIQQESCQRGWRLFSIVAAYFSCSDTLKPFLFKYLETAAYDKRRAYHGTAMVCLQNLRKTFKYGGRKNVPSVEEITAISAGRNSKRQIYRLPGGTEKVVNTKSTTVVQDVIEELCVMINVVNPQEMEEFSVYCIVEGDSFTMPLAREEYILDVTTELHKNHQVFYLIFCRSVWYFPLRLDSQLYVEVVFNQIAPDYLEGLLLILPGESLEQEVIYDISKIAALLHRAADMTEVPTMKETKFLLPKPALGVRDVKPSQWVNMVQSNWQECENLTNIQAKAQVLEALSKWPLFGSSFFAVKKVPEPKDRTDHILALNRNGVHFIDLMTHETLLHYPFSEVISTRKVKSEDGTLFLDMKCGNLMQQRITRLQTDQAHEISRLIRQYITMQQRMGPNQM